MAAGRRSVLSSRQHTGEASMATVSVRRLDDYAERMRVFRERADELRAQTAGRKHTPSEDLIREDRDNDHGHLHRV